MALHYTPRIPKFLESIFARQRGDLAPTARLHQEPGAARPRKLPTSPIAALKARFNIDLSHKPRDPRGVDHLISVQHTKATLTSLVAKKLCPAGRRITTTPDGYAPMIPTVTGFDRCSGPEQLHPPALFFKNPLLRVGLQTRRDKRNKEAIYRQRRGFMRSLGQPAPGSCAYPDRTAESAIQYRASPQVPETQAA